MRTPVGKTQGFIDYRAVVTRNTTATLDALGFVKNQKIRAEILLYACRLWEGWMGNAQGVGHVLQLTVTTLGAGKTIVMTG